MVQLFVLKKSKVLLVESSMAARQLLTGVVSELGCLPPNDRGPAKNMVEASWRGVGIEFLTLSLLASKAFERHLCAGMPRAFIPMGSQLAMAGLLV